MPALRPDLSFPLFGGGSTAAITDRLRLRLLHLGGTLIDDAWSSPDYTAPYWRAYLNLDDGVEIRCRGGAPTALLAGHLYLLPAWLTWAGRCRGRVRHLNASFVLPNLTRERVVERCTRVLHLGGPGAVLPDAWLALGADLTGVDQPSTLHVARGYALVYEALAAAFVQLGAAADELLTAPGEAVLADVISMIERNLGDHLPVARLATVGGCSEAELVRRFNAAYGTSPARWVRQRRVTVAADLLRCTDDDLESIAGQCGFTDRSVFSKAFSALLGCSPATWRRRERGG